MSIDRSDDDAELLALVAEFHQLDAGLRTWGTPDDSAADKAHQDLHDKWSSVAKRIDAIPAVTLAGFAAKASVIAPIVRDTTSLDEPTWGERLALSLARDLDAKVPLVDSDADLLRLCAGFDECGHRVDAIYASEPDDDLAQTAAALVLARQHTVAGKIMRSRVHSADGIVAIARSLAFHNGDGAADFQPRADTTTGRLMTARMREVCLFSGLPARAKLEGRAGA